MKIKTFKKIFLIVTSLLVISCERENTISDQNDTELSGNSDQDLAILESTKWSSNYIEVCWENPSSDNITERQWVKEQIEKTWEFHSKVRFWNWGTCSSGNKGIRIYIAEDHEEINPHTKGLGNLLDGTINGMVLDFDWGPCNRGRENCIRVIAVHEFGHALGFAHEHNRSDCRCIEEPNATFPDSYLTPCDIDSVMNYCNPKWNNDGNLSEFDILGVREIYGYHQFISGWDNENHVRTLADVNGDGKADIIGFGDSEVVVALSNGNSFSTPKKWHSDFTIGWSNTKHVRTLADVNGDGRADIVGFGNNDVLVALSNGSSFGTIRKWHSDFTGGWNNTEHVRTLADVNDDGKADIIGFGNNDVLVALSNGSSFGAISKWTSNFTEGWNNTEHVRAVADFDDNGRADIVGFGNEGVRMSPSTGNNFQGTLIGTLGNDYYVVGWNNTEHVRILADASGDGRADIIGFGDGGVFVSESLTSLFSNPIKWHSDFTRGWNNTEHIRTAADVNGDGKADIVGFGDNDVLIALSNGNSFSTPFRAF